MAFEPASSGQGSVVKALQFAGNGDRLSVLCLGAHSDDIEIGAGATLLGMMDRGIRLEVHWCVLSGAGDREKEAKASAVGFLSKETGTRIGGVPVLDGVFPRKGGGTESRSWVLSRWR